MLLSIGPLAGTLSGALQGARDGERDRLLNENYYLKNQQDWYNVNQQRDLWQDQTTAKLSEHYADAAQNFLTADKITQNRASLLGTAANTAKKDLATSQMSLNTSEADLAARSPMFYKLHADAGANTELSKVQTESLLGDIARREAYASDSAMTTEMANAIARVLADHKLASAKTALSQTVSAGNVVQSNEASVIATNNSTADKNDLIREQTKLVALPNRTPEQTARLVQISREISGIMPETGTTETGTTTTQTGNQGVALIGSTPLAVTPENSGVLNTLAKNVNNSALWTKILPGAQVNKDGNLILDGNNMGPALAYFNTQVVPKYNVARKASLVGQGATNTQAVVTPGVGGLWPKPKFDSVDRNLSPEQQMDEDTNKKIVDTLLWSNSNAALNAIDFENLDIGAGLFGSTEDNLRDLVNDLAPYTAELERLVSTGKLGTSPREEELRAKIDRRRGWALSRGGVARVRKDFAESALKAIRTARDIKNQNAPKKK